MFFIYSIGDRQQGIGARRNRQFARQRRYCAERGQESRIGGARPRLCVCQCVHVCVCVCVCWRAEALVVGWPGIWVVVLVSNSEPCLHASACILV
jgi:hypothetical protein